MNNACQWMHNLRRDSLNACVLSAIEGQCLTVTGLGRAINSQAKEKHCIKRADRLLSNAHLHREQRDIYHAMSQVIVNGQRRPVILVDWSDLDECREHFLIRAAIAVEGRSLTLYEEVHDIKTKEKPKTHRIFLKRLKTMLPADCKPIIVTDAGFRVTWFKEVEKLGWDWVGRIRNRNKVKQGENRHWVNCKFLYKKATSTAKSLGQVVLTQRHHFPCRMVIYKAKAKGRVDKNKFGQRARSKKSKENAAREREPWLLATSLPVTSKLAKQVKNIYATRMQIEEGFRDNKSTRYGLGFEFNGTRSIQRLQILLLIAMLASVVLWILGLIAIKTRQYRHYQANTITKKKVLSTVFLGLRVANDERFLMDESDIIQAGKDLWKMVGAHANGW